MEIKVEDTTPIIFIHYGDSFYLPYVLDACILTNPGKKIFLLGDDANAHYNKKEIRHFNFKDFEDSEEIALFNRVFRIVAGKEHLKKTYANQWLRFIFLRWFIIYNFVKKHEIQSFWTFDSDNLILSDLRPLEENFLDYDCTSQCRGSCMNGLINNQQVVKGYIDKINTLFQRQEYLEQQQKEFDESHPNYAFTEMRAFEVFCLEENPKVIKLNTIINGEAFDDCIACNHENMQIHKNRHKGQVVKKLYINTKKEIFSFHIPTQSYIKLHNLNMSWIDSFLFKRFFRFRFSDSIKNDTNQLLLIPIKQPFLLSLKNFILFFFTFTKNKFRNLFLKWK